MNHYVYRTKRGLLRTVQANTPQEAWATAARKHKPAVLYDLAGSAWVESANGNAVRESVACFPVDEARACYLDACAAELSPGAREHLRAGCLWTPSERCALHQRGLIVSTGPRSPLTDLGRAFVERIGGASCS